VVESAKAERIATARRWGVFVVLAALCSLANAQWLQRLPDDAPPAAGELFGQTLIGEWQAVNFANISP